MADLAESLRRVQEAGGEVLEATREDAAYAAVRDPVGVPLALLSASTTTALPVR